MTYVTTQTAHTMATALSHLNSNDGKANPWLALISASKIKVTTASSDKQRALLSAVNIVSAEMLRRAWQWM